MEAFHGSFSTQTNPSQPFLSAITKTGLFYILLILFLLSLSFSAYSFQLILLSLFFSAYSSQPILPTLFFLLYSFYLILSIIFFLSYSFILLTLCHSLLFLLIMAHSCYSSVWDRVLRKSAKETFSYRLNCL